MIELNFKKKLNQTGIPEFSPTHAGTLVPKMLWKMRSLPIHAKTTPAQSPVILMTLQMTLRHTSKNHLK